MTISDKGVRVAIILNGLPYYKKTFYRKFFPVLREAFPIQVFETNAPLHGMELAHAAVRDGFSTILAAGGDGTLHEVVNGVLSAGPSLSQNPTIGLIPIGSGNDFARTMQLKSDVNHTINLIRAAFVKSVNVGKIVYSTVNGGSGERYFINVADIGMGPEVVKRVAITRKRFGGAVAYYKSIIETFLNFKPLTVTAATPSWTWTGKLRSLAVANGKYYGHGLCIAPDARPDDDMFDFFICGNVSVFDFIRYSGKLKHGEYLKVKHVEYKREKAVTFTSSKQCLIEGDGELLGILPATVSLTDTRINFLLHANKKGPPVKAVLYKKVFDYFFTTSVPAIMSCRPCFFSVKAAIR